MKELYNDAIQERSILLGEYLVEHRSTVRAVAAKFHISKSTVHKDVTQTLKKLDADLYRAVKEILEINKKERHLRGGEATRKKYTKNIKANSQI